MDVSKQQICELKLKLKLRNLHDTITGKIPVKDLWVDRSVGFPRTVIAPHIINIKVMILPHDISKNTVETVGAVREVMTVLVM